MAGLRVNLNDPNNATNPVALEATIAENNRLIEEGFAEALSRVDREGQNYMCTSLDMNGNDILNVRFSPFIKKSELDELQVGNIRTHPVNGDLQFRPINENEYITLYTMEELQGAPGEPGDGFGDLVAANNLSDLADLNLARQNLGIPSLISDAVTGLASEDDSRFSRYDTVFFTDGESASSSGSLYILSPQPAATTSATLLVPNGTVGDVLTIAAPEGNAPVEVVLTAGEGVRLFIAGNSVARSSVIVPPFCIASVICVSQDGNDYMVTGPEIP